MPARRLQWIEAMRGLAACWVVLHHSQKAATAFFGPGTEVQGLYNGYLGVDFFFVLSGFIIAVSSARLVETGRGLSDYISARAIRIYVPYLPVGIAMLMLYTAMPGISGGTRDELSWLTSFTLLPAKAPPALSVAWTLVHELIFYAVFSLFFVSRRALVAVMAIWCAAIIASMPYLPSLGRVAGYLLSPMNLCFVLGVCTAWLTRKGTPNAFAVALVVGGLALVGVQALSVDPNRVLVAIGFAALVAAACAPAIAAIAPGRVLLALGSASYAIYLIHNPTISILARAGRHLESPLGAHLMITTGGIAAGMAYHYAYEKRALHAARRLAASVISRFAPAGA